MFNSKRDPGTEISAREASLSRGSTKNKHIPVKMEITVSQSQAVKSIAAFFVLLRKTWTEMCCLAGGL